MISLQIFPLIFIINISSNHQQFQVLTSLDNSSNNGVSFNINPLSSSLIFLTLSLHLFPSLVYFSFILLHVLSILVVVTSLSVAISPPTSTTLLTCSPQSSLASSKAASLSGCSPNGTITLKFTCIISVLIFFFEWVVVALSFLLMYPAFVDESNGGAAGASRFQK